MPNTARWYAQGLIHAHEIVMREMQGVCPTKQRPLRGPCNTSESHRVFCCLHGTCPDDLPSRSSLEFHRLLSEGINAFARHGGGLLNDDELCKARNQKGTGLLEFFIANDRERFHDALNVFLCQLVRMLRSNFLNQLRLRHQLWHLCLLPIRIAKLT